MSLMTKHHRSLAPNFLLLPSSWRFSTSENVPLDILLPFVAATLFQSQKEDHFKFKTSKKLAKATIFGLKKLVVVELNFEADVKILAENGGHLLGDAAVTWPSVHCFYVVYRNSYTQTPDPTCCST